MYLGDGAHRTQPGQGQKQRKSSGVHDYRIRLSGEKPSATASRDANNQRPFTGTSTSRYRPQWSTPMFVSARK